jgi:hypothetical protein
MEKDSTLYAIEEPAAPAERKILHLTGIRSHGPADPRPVERPWPPQNDWRDLQRRLEKSQAERNSGKTGKR